MKIAESLSGSGIHILPIVLLLVAAVLPFGAVYAQTDTSGDKDAILLTIFLKHDQSKNLEEIQAQLRKNGFYQQFPPSGVEVISWYVMMGIGQVVTLKVPAARLREVNLAIEHSAWGPFRTEFYPTYDYRPVWEAERKKGQ
jgi:hypothetical protein